MSVGKNIRILRRKHNLTIEDLSEKSNISVNSISKIERGLVNSINVSTLLKFSEVFNVTPNELLDFTLIKVDESKYKNLILKIKSIPDKKRKILLKSINDIIDLIND